MNPTYFETRFRLGELVLSWPDEFVIISAYATTGQNWTASENEEADHRLATELRRSRRWLARVVGYSPTSGHAEPSWAVELPLQEGRALGARYRQDAIYLVKAGLLLVTSCDASGKVILVGAFRERIEVVLI